MNQMYIRFVGVIAAVNETLDNMMLCSSDVVLGTTLLLSDPDTFKWIIFVLFIRLLDMGRCFMWTHSSVPHPSNCLAGSSLQVSHSLTVKPPAHDNSDFLLCACHYTANILAWITSQRDCWENALLINVFVWRYQTFCTRSRWSVSKEDLPAVELPATKQDMTEVQWDMSWMEMSNLLDKQLYPDT